MVTQWRMEAAVNPAAVNTTTGAYVTLWLEVIKYHKEKDHFYSRKINFRFLTVKLTSQYFCLSKECISSGDSSSGCHGESCVATLLVEAEKSDDGLVSLKQRLQNISADLDSVSWLNHLAANASATKVDLRQVTTVDLRQFEEKGSIFSVYSAHWCFFLVSDSPWELQHTYKTVGSHGVPAGRRCCCDQGQC